MKKMKLRKVFRERDGQTEWWTMAGQKISPELAEKFAREFQLNFVNVCVLATLYFIYYLTLEKRGSSYEQIWESLSHKDTLCHVWIKLPHWFWRRFLNYVNVFSLFCCYHTVENGEAFLLNIIWTVFLIFYYLPLQKGWLTSFEISWKPFLIGCFVQNLAEIGPMVLEKKMKLRKVFRERGTDRQMDGQWPIRKANPSLWKSSLELLT